MRSVSAGNIDSRDHRFRLTTIVEHCFASALDSLPIAVSIVFSDSVLLQYRLNLTQGQSRGFSPVFRL